jgi:hypothetical protein
VLFFFFWGLFLVLLVNDSEYSKSAGAKPIFKNLLVVFISFPWRAVRPHPTSPPLFGGGKVPKNTKKIKPWAWARWQWRYVSLDGLVC